MSWFTDYFQVMVVGGLTNNILAPHYVEKEHAEKVSQYTAKTRNISTFFCFTILYFPIPGFAPYCCPSHVAEAHSRIHLLQQVCNFGYYFGWQSLHDSSSDISSHLLASLSFLLGMSDDRFSSAQSWRLRNPFSSMKLSIILLTQHFQPCKNTPVEV